ncbi:MAG TPA: 2-phospho-L-lactate guanylyltransferase [Acetobacteraceae bacterium]
MKSVWAAVPVKSFRDAKQRLSSVLSPAQRQALSEAMLADVLTALSAARLAGIMVNTADHAVITFVRRFDARVISDRAGEGHTTAVAMMAQRLERDGVDAMLTMPGDIPRVTAAEIQAICAGLRPDRSFTIVPSHDEQGSNAVLLTPPTVVPLRFGDDSFFPHLAAARENGIEPRIVPLPGIGLDIDRPADLETLVRATPPLGTHTEHLLKEFGLSPH